MLNILNPHTWSSFLSACQGYHRLSWFSTILYGVQSWTLFQSQQSDVTEDEYLICCVPVLSKFSLFLLSTWSTPFWWLSPLLCLPQVTMPVLVLFQTSSFWYFTIKPFFHLSDTFSSSHILLNSLVNSFTATTPSLLHTIDSGCSLDLVLFR